MSLAVSGRGLHTGAMGAVRVERHAGPVIVRIDGSDVPIGDLRVSDTSRSTTVTLPGGHVVATVEHVLAALGGLGIHHGVAVVIEGRELPLADGGARIYADALVALDAPRSPAPLRVAENGVVETGSSRYEFAVDTGATGDAPERTVLEVAIDFGDSRIATGAWWRGDPSDFRERIAPARTFGFEHELEELLTRGLASHVDPGSVVVFGEGRVLSSGRAFTADEPARHKLLDLIGDLYLYGGPPRGTLRAVRPGHAATHEVMRRALAMGLVVRDER